MKVLVCGGRKYKNQEKVNQVLNNIHLNSEISEIVSGGASGADTLAIIWAVEKKIRTNVFPAEWNKYGKAAGAIRNQKMFDEAKPDIVVAFPGGTGTADMVYRSRYICVVKVEE